MRNDSAVRLLLTSVLAVSCSVGRGSDIPLAFPFPAALTHPVVATGPVIEQREGVRTFEMGGRRETIRGKTWTGHVRVVGADPRDRSVVATLERALVEGTGWEPVYRDESRDPPLVTLRRTRGGEYFWITLEGWPDDIVVTMVHRD